MSVHLNPNVVTDGLIFYVDAGSTFSAPSTTSNWLDLTNGYSITKFGSPVLQDVAGARAWYFNATGQYFEANVLQTQPTTNMTIEAWIYPEASELISGDRGTILRIHGGQAAYMSWNKSNAKLSNYWYGHDPAGYHETGAAMQRQKWHHVCSVWDFNRGVLDQYTDLVKTTATTSGNASTGSNIEIGMEGTSRQFSGGIAMVKVYNKALSESEVRQNFNAMRGRFSL